MATTHTEAIQKLYVAYFNRPADPAGLAYWNSVVEAEKGSTARVSAAFAAEKEYTTEYANMTNAQIVDKVYQNLFGRAAEVAGKDYWAKLLDDKAITIDQVVTQIAAGAQGTDAEAYENKVVAATAFTAAVDTEVEIKAYSGAEANAVAKKFMAGITTDASLAAAIAPAALNDTINKVVVAGTPFTVLSALKNLEAVGKAKDAFMDVADGTADGQVKIDDIGVGAKLTKADGDVATLVNNGAYATGSAAVKAALINDKVAANAKALTEAQATLAEANGAIAKVAGLTQAVATHAAAKTAFEAAEKTDKAADAELQSKVLNFKLLSDKVATVNDDGTVTVPAAVAGDPAVVLIKLDANKKLVLNTGVTETNNPGITALLAATTANEAAEAALLKAKTAYDIAILNVNRLDIDPDGNEVALLTEVKKLMVEVVVAKDAMPTEAQMAAQQKILDEAIKAAGEDADAKAAAEAKAAAFKKAVDDYHLEAAKNPLVADHTDATKAVKDAGDAITKFTKAVADLDKAKALVAEMEAHNSSIKAAEKVFADNGYNLEPVDQAFEVGSPESDVFVVGKVSSTISLFGLEGNDSLYLGSDYVLNTGKLSTGNNAVLEAFVAQVGGDTVLTVETSTFGSSATSAEVVTITLVGVTATDVVLNNGIITLGGTGA
jgi:hypothetical protein